MKAIRTLKDLQERNAAYAASKKAAEPVKETPAKQPKKRKHLVVEESEWKEPAQEAPEAEKPEPQEE